MHSSKEENPYYGSQRYYKDVQWLNKVKTKQVRSGLNHFSTIFRPNQLSFGHFDELFDQFPLKPGHFYHI